METIANNIGILPGTESFGPWERFGGATRESRGACRHRDDRLAPPLPTAVVLCPRVGARREPSDVSRGPHNSVNETPKAIPTPLSWPASVTTVATLDRMIRARHLLKHPFYTAWSRGEIPIETLGGYAEQYYHFEANFPRFVAATYARIPDARLRRTLLDNLVDEEGRTPTHPDLWLDVARSLGRPRNAVVRSRPSAATRHLLATYSRATFSPSAAAGLGALYAYESIFPEIAREKSRGLRDAYGIVDPRAHEFFRVHTTADVEHSGAERRVMQAVLRGSPRAAGEMQRHCARSIDAWWGFLDSFPVGS